MPRRKISDASLGNSPTRHIGLAEAHSVLAYPFRNTAGLKLLVMRSLVYFDNAETTDMPVMLKPLSWDEAKARLCDAIRATA